jgi:hypothetical protein
VLALVELDISTCHRWLYYYSQGCMIFDSDNINGDEKYLEKSLNQLLSIHNLMNLSRIIFREANVTSMIRINYSSYFSVK